MRRSSARECRQAYATTLLRSVKRKVSSASRIILAHRHRGRGRARSVGRTPSAGLRAPAMTAECCQISPTRTARSWLTPARPHLVAMQRQPLQGDHAEGVADLVAVQHGARLGERQHLDQNILALRLQPVDSAGVAGVDPPEEAGAGLGAGPRTYHDIVHRDHVADLESCFLYRLASDELLGLLVVLD